MKAFVYHEFDINIGSITKTDYEGRQEHECY